MTSNVVEYIDKKWVAPPEKRSCLSVSTLKLRNRIHNRPDIAHVFYDSDADLRALTSDGTLITTNRQCQIFDGVKVYQIDGNHREFWLNTGTFECTNVTQLENGVYRQNLIESYSTSVVRVYDTPAIKMHFGREHMFIKTESGYMVYGKNNYFQFGQETPAESNKFINAKDVNDEKFIEIYIGGLQGYGKKANGTFYGWGYNEKGRLGNGPSETHAQKPTLMPYHKLNIVEVFPAGWSTMGLTSSGDLYGWGIIGNDYKVTTAPTLLVKNKIRQVFTGPYEKTYFAVTKTGKVFAWGQDSTLDVKKTPTEIPDLNAKIIEKIIVADPYYVVICKPRKGYVVNNPFQFSDINFYIN